MSNEPYPATTLFLELHNFLTTTMLNHNLKKFECIYNDLKHVAKGYN